jgi:phosphoribosylformylglycinamidine cyclo-ligase
MSDRKGMTYADAGLDLETYAQTMAGIAPLLTRTWDTTRVMAPKFKGAGGKGGAFASLFDLDPNRGLFRRKYKHPVLVTCTDGVGSKLKLAGLMNQYDTVGIDLVAMSVNDLICTGGEPLTFLDYIAMPKDDPALTRTLVQGISDGCLESDCALVGGETAILPDFYTPGDFDMAGFCTGVVEKDRIIDGSAIQVGDAVIGIASSGVHSNGYSLVRKIVFDRAKFSVNDHVPELNTTVGQALLTPTRLYVRPILKLLNHYPVKKRVIRGLANITGGGLPDNLGRILAPGRRAVLSRRAWPRPPLFAWLKRLGDVAVDEMEKVFNVGIGFVIVASPHFAESILKQLHEINLSAWRIGRIEAGDAGVQIDD